MFTFIYFRILRRLQALIDKAIKPLYLNPDNASLFPLSKVACWRRMQSSLSPVIGMTSDREAELLFFLSTFQDLQGDVMEIGSWLGKSTVHLALGCKVSKNGIVHAIDTFGGNKGKEDLYTAPVEEGNTIYSQFKKNVSMAKLSKFVRVHKKPSEKIGAEIGKNIRCAFIDGCHEYEFVLHDITLCFKKLLPGGLLILDDFTSHFPGVVRAVKEKIVNNSQFEVLFTVDSLFVARKK